MTSDNTAKDRPEIKALGNDWCSPWTVGEFNRTKRYQRLQKQFCFLLQAAVATNVTKQQNTVYIVVIPSTTCGKPRFSNLHRNKMKRITDINPKGNPRPTGYYAMGVNMTLAKRWRSKPAATCHCISIPWADCLYTRRPARYDDWWQPAHLQRVCIM